MNNRVLYLLRARFQLRQATALLDAELDEIAMPKSCPSSGARFETLKCTLLGVQADIRNADMTSQKDDEG